MNKQPLLICALAFILGILFQEYFGLGKVAVIFLVSIAFLSLLLLFSKNIFVVKIAPFLPVLFFCSVGIFFHRRNSEKPDLPNFASKDKIIFKINKKLNSNEKNRRYEIDFWQGSKRASAVLSVPKSEPQFDFNHYYRAEAYINNVRPAQNDYQFDYGKYLARKNIFYQIYLPNGFQTSTRNDISFSEKISQKHLEFLTKIDTAKLSAKTREFLKGIVLADRTDIDRETVADFSRTGLAHILAISGSHIAVIFGIFYFLMSKILPARQRRTAIISSLILIWMFATFIGFGNSVVRSCIMLSVYFIYVLLQRKPDLLHAMALAALIILCIDTHQIFDVGFQLSFLAVLGIFWLNPPLLELFPKPRNKVQDFMANVATVTFAAQIATLPLVLYHFHQFSFISIVANLVMIPMAELIILFSLLMTVLIAFNFNFNLLYELYDWCTLKFLDFIHWFSGFDSLFFKNISMSVLEVLVLFAGVYLLRFLLLKFNLKNVMSFGFVMLLFFVLKISLDAKAFGKDEVLVHQYFKEKMISVKNKDNVYFWINENADQAKIEQYIIDPYLTSRRTHKVFIEKIPENSAGVRIGKDFYSLK